MVRYVSFSSGTASSIVRYMKPCYVCTLHIEYGIVYRLFDRSLLTCNSITSCFSSNKKCYDYLFLALVCRAHNAAKICNYSRGLSILSLRKYVRTLSVAASVRLLTAFAKRLPSSSGLRPTVLWEKPRPNHASIYLVD